MTGMAKDESDQMRSSLARDAIDLSSRFGMAAFAATVRRAGERAACLDGGRYHVVTNQDLARRPHAGQVSRCDRTNLGSASSRNHSTISAMSFRTARVLYRGRCRAGSLQGENEVQPSSRARESQPAATRRDSLAAATRPVTPRTRAASSAEMSPPLAPRARSDRVVREPEDAVDVLSAMDTVAYATLTIPLAWLRNRQNSRWKATVARMGGTHDDDLLSAPIPALTVVDWFTPRK